MLLAAPAALTSSPLEVLDLLPQGVVRYEEALALQRDLVQKRQRGAIGDTLILLRHPPTVTFGKTARPENLLLSPDEYKRRGIEVIPTDRGGDVTYHGPGQVVGYPIIHLGEGSRDVHRYVRDLETVLIHVAHDFGVRAAGRATHHAGVWIGDAYLAALGVRVSRWVAHHGFALNVAEEVRTGFDTIVPCGVQGKEIATLEESAGRPVSDTQVAEALIRRFEEVYRSSMQVRPHVWLDI